VDLRETERAVYDQLDREGFIVLEGFFSDSLRHRLIDRLEELYAEEGDAAGSEFRPEPGTRRLANLVDKGDIFREVFANEEILGYIGHILRLRFKLSSLNARSANPDQQGHQPLHVDQGLLPDGTGPVVANVVWMLDDFTPENGAMRAVPRTHLSGARPPESHPDEVLVTGSAGTVCVMNAHLWHGGTANRTDRPRRAIHSFYCRFDVAQQQYQKRLLRPEVQASMPALLRALLALDDSLNDELCSRVTNQSGFLK
jgi:hypothetical protein